MRKIVLSISSSLLIIATSFVACNKDNGGGIQAKKGQDLKAISFNSPAMADPTGYRFGWTVLNLSDYCEPCPFWLCKGTWKPLPGPNKVQVSETGSYAYIQNGKLIFEVDAEADIDKVMSYIKDGKIEIKSPSSELQFMEIPEELVESLGLGYDKIYPGIYSAERVEGTNKVRIAFN